MLTVLRHDGAMAPVTSCFFATARSCLVHLIRRFHPDVAVMPGMVPAGLTRPFESEKIPIRHYRLTDGLEADIADLEKQMAGVRRPIVIVVHYFGYAMPTYEAALIAHDHGGILVADCAHCLTSPDPEGDCSDVTLYSLNKVLPVTDGALMYSRSPTVDVTKKDRTPPFPPDAFNAYRHYMMANRLIANCPPGSDPGRALKQSKAAYDEYYALIDRDMEPYEPSEASASILRCTNLDVLRAARAANADAIYRALPSDQIVRDGSPVFAFPVRVQDRKKAAAALWWEAGTVAQWIEDRWRIPSAGDPASKFFHNHLILPINEGIKPEQAERLAHVVCGL